MVQVQAPDYHFLYFAPGVGMDYLFRAARQFIQTFQVQVIQELDIIAFVPVDRSVVLTSLARTDTVGMVRELVNRKYGNRIYHDLLVYDFVADAELTLNIRTERNEPFGVPLG